jgi:hypothetical protein
MPQDKTPSEQWIFFTNRWAMLNCGHGKYKHFLEKYNYLKELGNYLDANPKNGWDIPRSYLEKGRRRRGNSSDFRGTPQSIFGTSKRNLDTSNCFRGNPQGDGGIPRGTGIPPVGFGHFQKEVGDCKTRLWTTTEAFGNPTEVT